MIIVFIIIVLFLVSGDKKMNKFIENNSVKILLFMLVFYFAYNKIHFGVLLAIILLGITIQSDIKKVVGKRLQENFNLNKIKNFVEKFTEKNTNSNEEESESDSDSDNENNIDTMVPEKNKLLSTYDDTDDSEYKTGIKKLRETYNNIVNQINNLR